jgi:hypothetical protein
MYREEEAFKIIVGAEGARPVWGSGGDTQVPCLSSFPTPSEYVQHLIPFSCTIWWLGKPSLKDLYFLREESRAPDLQGLPTMAICTSCSHGAMSFTI